MRTRQQSTTRDLGDNLSHGQTLSRIQAPSNLYGLSLAQSTRLVATQRAHQYHCDSTHTPSTPLIIHLLTMTKHFALVSLPSYLLQQQYAVSPNQASPAHNSLDLIELTPRRSDWFPSR
jgi:hypothetical protein